MKKKRKVIGLCFIFVFTMLLLLSSVVAFEENYWRTYQTTHHQDIQNYKPYEIHKITETTTQTRNLRTSYCNSRTPYSCNRASSYYNRKSTNTIHYSQYGTQTSRKSFLGDYVKEYSAYVTNRGRTGRYFTVVFTLEDKNGYVFDQSVTQYLRTGEKKRFVYKDIQYERNEILDWSYEIIPER